MTQSAETLKYRYNNEPEYYQRKRESMWKNRGILSMTGDGFLKYAEYAQALEVQNHECLICKTHVNGNGHADHDHETHLFRGILCTDCNKALGFLEKNLDAVVNYLRLTSIEERR